MGGSKEKDKKLTTFWFSHGTRSFLAGKRIKRIVTEKGRETIQK